MKMCPKINPVYRRHVESKHIVGTVYPCSRCAFTTNTEAKFRKHDREHDKADALARAQELTVSPGSNPLLVGEDIAVPNHFEEEEEEQVEESMVEVEPEIVEPRFDIDIDDVNVDDV